MYKNDIVHNKWIYQYNTYYLIQNRQWNSSQIVIVLDLHFQSQTFEISGMTGPIGSRTKMLHFFKDTCMHGDTIEFYIEFQLIVNDLDITYEWKTF